MVDRDERAVSDVIAFVLVFSIIITSVGFVYAVGFGALTDLQEGEQQANAERSMSALAVAMDDILRERSGDRAADINLAGETMTVDDDYQLEVEINETAGNETETIDGALVYGVGSDTQIIYMGGAVIRVDPNGAFVTRGPRFACRNDGGRSRSVVTAPTITDDDNEGGLSSDGSVRVEAEISNRLASTLTYTSAGNDDVEYLQVTVTDAPTADLQTRIEAAWEQWFDRQDGWESDGTCEFSNDDGTVFVRNAAIDISYII